MVVRAYILGRRQLAVRYGPVLEGQQHQTLEEKMWEVLEEWHGSDQYLDDFIAMKYMRTAQSMFIRNTKLSFCKEI